MTNSLWGRVQPAPATTNTILSPDALLKQFAQECRSFGVEHFIAAGLPLPGRDLGKLVLFQQWGNEELTRAQLSQIKGDDVLMRRIAVLKKPTLWCLSENMNNWLQDSVLIKFLRAASLSPDNWRNVVGMHIHEFDQLQLFICLSGVNITIPEKDLIEMKINLHRQLSSLHANRPILCNRPGELSSREKMVLGLTAEGKTAGDIAHELKISQRTVHAHLQNASEKLQAANKTQTVVEAIRYGQIELR